MKERTCILIKPDGVEKKVAGKVVDALEREGFDIRALKMVPPDKRTVENFYSAHKGKPFFDAFIDFMTSGPFIAMVWEGEKIIERARKMVGATISKEAMPGTLRRLYGTDGRRNLVHASDSAESAEKEIFTIFKESEIIYPLPIRRN